MIVKTDHIAINVTDMEKCIPFWRDILGLKQTTDFTMKGEFLDTVQARKNMEYRIVKFVSPEGFMLELLEDYGHKIKPQKKMNLQKSGLRHFAFEVKDVDKAFEQVKSAGCETISGPATSEDGSMRLFFVRDPENNLIELMEFPNK